MMKRKVKFVDIGEYAECYCCNGKGKIYHEARSQNGQPKGYGTYFPCETCGGEGKFKRTNYHLICEYKNGNKIAFVVDTVK